MRVERKINLSDFVQRAVLLQELSEAKGWHNVEVSPARPKASQQQHSYYRAVVLPIAKLWLCENQGEDFDDTSAHEFLKSSLRGKPVADPETGEQIGTIAKSHSEYTTREMVEFVDDVVELLRRFDVPVPPPDPEWREHRAKVLAA